VSGFAARAESLWLSVKTAQKTSEAMPLSFMRGAALKNIDKFSVPERPSLSANQAAEPPEMPRNPGHQQCALSSANFSTP
jgi:hypothetical protein